MAKRKRIDETETTELIAGTSVETSSGGTSTGKRVPWGFGIFGFQNALVDAVDTKKIDIASIDDINTSALDLSTCLAFIRHAPTFLSWHDVRNAGKMRIHVCHSKGFCDRDIYSFSLVLIDSQSQCIEDQNGEPYQVDVKVSTDFRVWFHADLVNDTEDEEYYASHAYYAWNTFRRTLVVPSTVYNIDILRAIISLVDSKLDPKASNDINQSAPGDPLVAFQHWSFGDIGQQAFPREIHLLIGEFIGYHHDEEDIDWSFLSTEDTH